MVVVTPNPALDRTVATDAEQLARVTRTRFVAQKAGGKGLNVVRVLDQLAVPEVVAVAPLGGHEGRQFEALAQADGVDLRMVPVSAPTRMSLTCHTGAGDVLELNEAGGGLTAEEWRFLAELIVQLTATGDTVVLAGSLPSGVDEHMLAELVGWLHGAGVEVIVDTSGPMLAAAVEASVDLVAPNVDEARQAFGMSEGTASDIAESLARRGVAALVSDGANCAAFADTDGQLHAVAPPVVDVVSTVGAGDALLAGWLAGRCRGQGAGPALRLATIVGAAACAAPTAGPVELELVERLLRDASPSEMT